MLNHEQIQYKFGVSVSPIIDSVDENHDTRSGSSSHTTLLNIDTRSTSSLQTIPFNIDTRPTASGGYDDKPRQTKIKLPQNWAMVAAHPTFKLEYKDYIRNYRQLLFS
jgi:hypothetical protein